MSEHPRDLPLRLVDDTNDQHVPNFPLTGGMRHLGVVTPDGRVVATVWNHHNSMQCGLRAAVFITAINEYPENFAIRTKLTSLEKERDELREGMAHDVECMGELMQEKDRYKAALEGIDRWCNAVKDEFEPVSFMPGCVSRTGKAVLAVNLQNIAKEALSHSTKTRSEATPERSEEGTGGELVGGVDGPDTMNEGAQG